MKLAILILSLLLIATPAWGASLTLTWTDNSNNEDGFRVHRRLGDTGAWGNVQNLDANVTTWTDATVLEDQKYCYRVKAFRGTLESGFSNVVCGTAKTQEVAPTDPTVLKFQFDLTCTAEEESPGNWTITCPAAP